VTRDPGTPVTDLAQTEHRTLTRRLNPGEVLRLEHLKTAMTVHAGDPVRIQITGRHFQIISVRPLSVRIRMFCPSPAGAKATPSLMI